MAFEAMTARESRLRILSGTAVSAQQTEFALGEREAQRETLEGCASPSVREFLIQMRNFRQHPVSTAATLFC